MRKTVDEVSIAILSYSSHLSYETYKSYVFFWFLCKELYEAK
jgi:hypothetical protein